MPEYLRKAEEEKMLRLVVGLVLMHVASGWKPVVGPTAYHHITNHHPVMGTQNTIVEGDGTARVSGGHSITYHGNIFPQQQSQHEDEPVSVVLNAGEPGGLDDGDLVEGRVLSGIADNKYLDHGFAALGVVGHIRIIFIDASLCTVQNRIILMEYV